MEEGFFTVPARLVLRRVAGVKTWDRASYGDFERRRLLRVTRARPPSDVAQHCPYGQDEGTEGHQYGHLIAPHLHPATPAKVFAIVDYRASTVSVECECDEPVALCAAARCSLCPTCTGVAITRALAPLRAPIYLDHLPTSNVVVPTPGPFARCKSPPCVDGRWRVSAGCSRWLCSCSSVGRRRCLHPQQGMPSLSQGVGGSMRTS